jgi:hypothetical protein
MTHQYVGELLSLLSMSANTSASPWNADTTSKWEWMMVTVPELPRLGMDDVTGANVSMGGKVEWEGGGGWTSICVKGP